MTRVVEGDKMKVGFRVPYTFMGGWRAVFNRAVSLNVNIVEVDLGDPRFQAVSNPVPMARRIKEMASSQGIEIYVKAYTPDMNLASLNNTIRSASQRLLIQAVRFAQSAGSNYVVFDPGYLPREYPSRLINRARSLLARTISNVSRLTGGTVTLLIENSPKADRQPLASTIEDLKTLSETLNCKLALNIGHANTVGNVVDFINELKDFIEVVHLSDNNGEQDSHLPIGYGRINYRRVISALKSAGFDGAYIIDVNSPAGIGVSMRRLNALLQSTR
ncbi:MAG: hypothetical protein DRJ52_02705 [Thermoprotei archaeon]|nr:MAG: hypothetical protein DRJ52_02705 [Thermoprotei archaeon]RLE99878.1 MAG: hypothetical protein DRJ63_04075 [Thermoprotei archaeon]HDI74692.1 hypothetical protein [Thermoprotei archaeon]